MKIGQLRFLKYTGILILLCLWCIPAACTTSYTTSPISITPSSTVIGQTISISINAENMAFDRTTITVPAGADVLVIFTNKDRVPHNIAFYETKTATKQIYVGEVFTGLKTVNYRFTAPLTPGTYFFRCDVHPTTMTGDFIVTK